MVPVPTLIVMPFLGGCDAWQPVFGPYLSSPLTTLWVDLIVLLHFPAFSANNFR